MAGDLKTLDAALDELYAAPLDGFVRVRKLLADRLRSAGDDASGRTLATATKPTRIAWALNQVARRRPDLLAEVVRTRKSAEAAQGADAEAIRSSVQTHRKAVDAVLASARDALSECGARLDAVQTRRMADTPAQDQLSALRDKR